MNKGEGAVRYLARQIGGDDSLNAAVRVLDALRISGEDAAELMEGVSEVGIANEWQRLKNYGAWRDVVKIDGEAAARRRWRYVDRVTTVNGLGAFPVDVMPDALADILSTVNEKDSTVVFQGETLKLGRTDLKDNVMVGCADAAKLLEAGRKAQLGARIWDGGLYLICSLSDG